MIFLASGSSPPARGTPAFHRLDDGEHRFIPARAGNTRLRGRPWILVPVHPRPRGEHIGLDEPTVTHYGSSPPARGTHLSIVRVKLDERFIPARAGNTSGTHSNCSARSVHPRPRGEHRMMRPQRPRNSGSSPPARGTPLHARRQIVSNRFIPARAGNTTHRPRMDHDGPVHPRPRGEHPGAAFAACLVLGSSPPARGTHLDRLYLVLFVRFIPARAGNTKRCPGARCRTSVHPRPRGEHRSSPFASCSSTGSSPPARGTPRTQDRRPRTRRFIPARAGNTSDRCSRTRISAVHPRPRGEHSIDQARKCYLFGSSPPARGTRALARAALHVRRFIPARAGNTILFSRNISPVTVHPRPRGEHRIRRQVVVRHFGSSPPARGTHPPIKFGPLKVRFIPARAGNTIGAARALTPRPVHPRPRGEHDPRPGRARPGGRFIPARAGNTLSRVLRGWRSPVHPRPRGEHWDGLTYRQILNGSSPPARGTLTAL